jgi:hypothetical protein
MQTRGTRFCGEKAGCQKIQGPSISELRFPWSSDEATAWDEFHSKPSDIQEDLESVEVLPVQNPHILLRRF